MSEQAPSISVIVPIYNVAEYLPRCLDALVGQTFDDIEILCYDDCSTDASFAILQDYAALDSRIRVEQMPVNGGVAKVRNACLDVARGEYICFVDPDDQPERRLCELLLHWAKEGNAELVWGGRRKFDVATEKLTGGNLFLFDPTFTKIAPPGRVEKTAALPFFLSWEPWGKLIRRELLQRNNVRFQELQVCEDMRFGFEVSLLAESVAVCYESIYTYTANRVGAHSREEGRKRFEVFDAIDATIAMFKRHEAFEQHALLLHHTLQQHLFQFCMPRIAKEFRKEFYVRTQDFVATLPPAHLTLEGRKLLGAKAPKETPPTSTGKRIFVALRPGQGLEEFLSQLRRTGHTIISAQAGQHLPTMVAESDAAILNGEQDLISSFLQANKPVLICPLSDEQIRLALHFCKNGSAAICPYTNAPQLPEILASLGFQKD